MLALLDRYSELPFGVLWLVAGGVSIVAWLRNLAEPLSMIRRRCFLPGLLAAVTLAVGGVAHAQSEPVTPSSTPPSATTQTEAPAAAAIPLVEVAADAEAASA